MQVIYISIVLVLKFIQFSSPVVPIIPVVIPLAVDLSDAVSADLLVSRPVTNITEGLYVVQCAMNDILTSLPVIMTNSYYMSCSSACHCNIFSPAASSLMLEYSLEPSWAPYLSSCSSTLSSLLW